MKITGLTTQEVVSNREKFGNNKIVENKDESFLKQYLGAFADPIIKILVFCCTLFFVLAFLKYVHISEPIAILVAISVATLVSTLNEYSSGKKFRKLQEEASRILVKVIRDSNLQEILIDEVVMGDIVILQAGDKIPADGYIMSGNLSVDNAVLNGETEENKKFPADTEILDFSKVDFTHPQKLYRGAIVVSGEGTMKIITTGMNTENGKLMAELSVEDVDSPLKIKLTDLAGKISKFGYIGAVIVGLFNFGFITCIQNSPTVFFTVSNSPIILKTALNSLLYAIIIIVMAVPEGLPLMIAIVLSQNMKKMLKDNVLVRKLIGIETAGSLNILFSDKTGTITKGRLEVVEAIDVSGNTIKNKEKDISETDIFWKLLGLSIHYNTSAVMSNGKVIGGNGTEKALSTFISPLVEADILDKLAFNSTNKYSASIIKYNSKNYLLVKGAPEKLINLCKNCNDSELGSIELLQESTKELITNEINKRAEKSIRVLSFAIKELPDNISKIEDIKMEDLTYLGFVGIRDEVRPEATQAIAECKRAGIQVVMITGDRKETAVAIAKDSGLYETYLSEKQQVLTSDELSMLSDTEVKEMLPNLRVIARALPLDKQRLVKLSQELNLVVGMTGDGVNDSPALKKADVGFAMGSGTEITKEVSDIIILDDNFKSIENAVLYGRTIYKNIQKFLKVQLNINISAVLISVIAPFIGIPQPLTIIQILWINMVMDTLAALALGGEPSLPYYMKESPKSRNENIISKSMGISILWTGIWTTILGISFLKFDLFPNVFVNDTQKMTAFFSIFVLSGILNALNTRNDGFNVFKKITQNKNFILIMVLIFGIQYLITTFGGEVFGVYPMTPKEWIIVLGLSVLIIPIDMVRKLIFKK